MADNDRHLGAGRFNSALRTSGMTRTSRIAALVAYGVILSGCATVGPNFERPAPPTVDRYTARALPARTSPTPGILGEAQQFEAGAAVAAEWWRTFNSPRLDALVAESLAASPTIEAAEATLRQAQHTYHAQAGATLYPQVGATLGAQRKRTNTAALGQSGGERLYELYNAGATVSYNLDLPGGNRRALEGLVAQVDYRRYRLYGARLTLAANLASSAMVQAQLARQIAATEDIVAAQAAQLIITKQRVALGAASENDVLALRTQLEQLRATLPPLRNRLDQTTHLLAVLSGQPPGAAAVPQFDLAEFSLPAHLPVTMPSDLVRRRPDIQASEALLHAASAQVGLADAKRYPQLTLSGNIGSQTLTAARLFGAGSLVWGLAGQLAQPLFNRGLPAEKRAAEAAYDAAAANYRDIVLHALRETADVLRGVEHNARALAAQAAASASAQQALELMRRQYELGGASYLEVLNAEQQAQHTQIALVSAQARRLVDTVALYQAMGGGWGDEQQLAGLAAAAR